MSLSKRIVLPAAVCLAAVAITVMISSAERRRNPNDPGSAAAGALHESALGKSRLAAAYREYARVAFAEGHLGAGRLFQALAVSEGIHLKNHIVALKNMGEKNDPSYDHANPPAHLMPEVSDTRNNIYLSSMGEKRQFIHIHPSLIDRALNDHSRYAARTLLWASGSDAKHYNLLTRFLDRFDAEESGDAHFWVCPTCGNTFGEEGLEGYCPFCMTHQSKYLKF